MILYYSGAGSLRHGVPETVFGNDATLMLSFTDFIKTLKPNGRFKAILKARQKGKHDKHQKRGTASPN